MNSTYTPNIGLASVDYDPFAAAALARVGGSKAARGTASPVYGDTIGSRFRS